MVKITTVDDYIDQVSEKFPELPKNEIKRILTYGWKMILLYVRAGNDVNFLTRGYMFFIGRLVHDSLRNFEIYCNKLAKRIRYMFNRKKLEWDGYYFFALTDAQYEDYLKQSRKKYKIFLKVVAYKLIEEAKLKERGKRYIFRLNNSTCEKASVYYPYLKTKDAELVVVRDPLKMKDIMTSYNKFKYIT